MTRRQVRLWKIRSWPVSILAVLTVSTLAALAFGSAQAQVSANLLVNPGFEDEGRWPFQDNVREAMLAPGWFAFWRDAPPEDMPLPSNCPRRSDTGCYRARPEFREVKAVEFPRGTRLCSGPGLDCFLRQ